LTHRNRVLLPAPLAPTTAAIVPVSTVKSMLSRTVCDPSLLVRPVISII